MGIRLCGEPAPHGEVRPCSLQRGQHFCVPLWPHHDHDAFVVLRRGSDHRGTADVDLLDRLFEGHVGAAHCFHERIEVAAEEVDGLEPVTLERLHVLWLVAAREQAGVHPWVQGLDAAIHHLRKAGQVCNGMRIDRGVRDRLQRVAGRVELETEALQTAREPGQPALVTDRQQGSGQVSSPTTGWPRAGSCTPLRGYVCAASPPYRPSKPGPPPGPGSARRRDPR